MRGSSDMVVGEHLKAGWLPVILTFFVISGLMGCAPAQVAPTSSPPLIRQVPVRVSTAPVKPESKYAPKEKRPPTGETFGDERGMERYAARLKEIQIGRASCKERV